MLLFLNKASLLYACLTTKIILWSTQEGTFKLTKPKQEHRNDHQSLVNSLSLSFLFHQTKINNPHAKLVEFSSLISRHMICFRDSKNVFAFIFD